VNFVDATVIRLADPSSRSSVFDAVALGQLVEAGYDAATLAVEGPFSPVFDEFRLGPPSRPAAHVDGAWSPIGSVERTEIQLRVPGLGLDGVGRVDAVWRGAIVARVVTAGGTVAGVAPAWPDPSGIDQEIVEESGTLPADPVALEAARRTHLLARIRAVAAQPDAVTEAALDAWLARLGVAGVGELLDGAPGGGAGGVVQVAFDPGPATSVPRPLPLTALLLVRDAGFSVADLVAETNVLREVAATLGLERPADATLPRRVPVLVVWVVPPEVFDDQGWPGGTSGTPEERRASRRAAAGTLLAREGIGLVVAAPP
jgi:hypothetical protein